MNNNFKEREMELKLALSMAKEAQRIGKIDGVGIVVQYFENKLVELKKQLINKTVYEFNNSKQELNLITFEKNKNI